MERKDDVYYAMSKISGEKLRQLRKEKKVSIVQVAKDLGVTRQCISSYERGIRVPSDKMKYKLAAYYDVGINYLFYTV